MARTRKQKALEERRRRQQLWQEVRAETTICAICGEPIKAGERATIDHIYPRSKGGDDSRKNLQCVHRHCNMLKSDLIPWAYCRPREHPWESFDEVVYDVVRRIPWGKVMTYGQIARLLGDAHLAGAVALALRRAPHDYPRVTKRGNVQALRSGKIPCHRVVGSNGELATYLGSNGVYDHRKRLRRERVYIEEMKVRLELYKWYGKREIR